jgi:hypothetical protein
VLLSDYFVSIGLIFPPKKKTLCLAEKEGEKWEYIGRGELVQSTLYTCIELPQ